MGTESLYRRLVLSGAIIAAVIILGTLGYMLIEGWPLLDGLYMSVITLSTVGYGETNSLSIVGRFFTLGLIVLSITSLAFWTASLTSVFIQGDLSGATRRRRILKMAQHLSNHTIICGAGVMAQAIIDRLRSQQLDVVLITDNQTEIERMGRMYRNLLIIENDPTNELALADANVLMAGTVVCVLESDFDNLMIAMTCKELGPHLKVIARANNKQVASRLAKLGVENVVCPFQMTGNVVADLIADSHAQAT